MDWRERISIDPGICHGKPCIMGTRVLVSVILESLAEGESNAGIRESYPSIADEDIAAVLHYAAF
jgi:uncharacterized protein (DUF433 family)